MASLLLNLWISSERVAAAIACCVGAVFMTWFLVALLLETKKHLATQSTRLSNLEKARPSVRVHWVMQPKRDKSPAVRRAEPANSAIACDDGTWARGVAIPAHVFSLSEARTVKKLRWEWR
jgi:hypothetical protein